MPEQAQFASCTIVYALYLVTRTKYRRKCIDAPTWTKFREIAESRCSGWAGSLLKLMSKPITSTC